MSNIRDLTYVAFDLEATYSKPLKKYLVNNKVKLLYENQQVEPAHTANGSVRTASAPSFGLLSPKTLAQKPAWWKSQKKRQERYPTQFLKELIRTYLSDSVGV